MLKAVLNFLVILNLLRNQIKKMKKENKYNSTASWRPLKWVFPPLQRIANGEITGYNGYTSRIQPLDLKAICARQKLRMACDQSFSSNSLISIRNTGILGYFKKAKLLILFIQVSGILAGIFGMIYLQHNIINVSAQVDPVAFVGPNAEFGIVFPSEIREKDFYVKAQDDYNGSVSYNLITRVKPRAVDDGAYCFNNPSDYEKCYPLLCDYLDIVSTENESDTKDSAKLTPPNDKIDSWKVVLNTPPINGFAGQNFDGNSVESVGEYGCDIELVLRGSSGGGGYNLPVVKAKWEMNADKNKSGKYLGSDDSADLGAQFLPSGQFETGKNIAVCAIVADSDGVADINAVYADVFYPIGISTGLNHDSEHLGCGRSLGEFSLARLGASDGYDLFCDRIKNNNNSLPTFFGSYNYDEICAEGGDLMKKTAEVYCGEKILSYEDPSGDYRTLVLAQDSAGLTSSLENQFAYLPVTAFDIDFEAISYGKVRLNTHKIISGDVIFQEGDGKATVRNAGNTRFDMGIAQDDAGLGKNDLGWNVFYGGRVGFDANFVNYYPGQQKNLPEALDLSETNEMDFSIDVLKFPSESKDNYNGEMTLNAVQSPYLVCE